MLITLGIIGVVAAMTIPNMIANYQKKVTAIKLQKAISILNQAYRSSFTENSGEPSADEAYVMGNAEYFNTYWAPYVKTSVLCTSHTICGYESAFPFKKLKGDALSTALFSKTGRTTFYTPDGVLYMIFIAEGNKAEGTFLFSSRVYVDLNGGDGPNTMGKDVFVLTRKNGAIIPMCSLSSDVNINSSCSKTGYGDCCAERIKRAGWKIDKAYPW